jgi:hypothetical protein
MTNPPTEPVLVRIADLHPTQITVGIREVAEKRLRWRSRIRNAAEKGGATLIAPIVLGPAGALYLIDRHHLACAMKDEGVQEVQIRQLADFSALDPQDLWPALEDRGWCRPFDTNGRRQPFGAIPHTLDRLCDDPLRSLASALRRAGGFTKRAAPFSEFAWADFLRHRISRDLVLTDFDGALNQALILARTLAARGLPGWRLDPATKAGDSPPVSSPHVYG